MIKLNRKSIETDSRLLGLCRAGFSQLLDRKDIGFFSLPERDQGWEASRQRADQVQSNFENFVFVGIGGSGLGGKMVHQFLSSGSEKFANVHFLENIDPISLDLLFQKFDVDSRWHWTFISKSGSTLETLMLANAVEARLSEKNIQLTGVSTVISEDKESPLMKWARASKVPELHIDLDVGGRFSVLTPVGLFPAAILGQDLVEMREGARWAFHQADLVSELAAQFLASFDRQEWISQYWFYSDQLRFFGDWVQQLWAESLSKKQSIDEGSAPRVSTPSICVGAIDQHSVLQQLVEGAPDKFLIFSRLDPLFYKDSIVPNQFAEIEIMHQQSLSRVFDAEACATFETMQDLGKSAIELLWTDLSPKTLGSGIMLFELIVGTLGEVLSVNAYDQPGVEAGKLKAKNILKNKY